MAQPAPPKYVQTILIIANIQPFRGLRADGELHFQPGSDVLTWQDSVDAYYLAAGITQDAEKLRLQGSVPSWIVRAGTPQ